MTSRRFQLGLNAFIGTPVSREKIGEVERRLNSGQQFVDIGPELGITLAEYVAAAAVLRARRDEEGSTSFLDCLLQMRTK